MEKLLALKADMLCEGHAGVYKGDKVRKYIEGYLERYRAQQTACLGGHFFNVTSNPSRTTISESPFCYFRSLWIAAREGRGQQRDERNYGDFDE